MKAQPQPQSAGLVDLRTGFYRHCLLLRMIGAIGLLLPSLTLLAQGATTNQLPNPQFRGTNGTVVNQSSTVTGTVPTLWRLFGVNSAGINADIVPVAANAIFPGSPATNAVRLTVTAFGADQGLDTSQVRFSLVPNQQYQYRVYLRSDNGDNSNQNVNVGVAQFDQSGAFVSGLGSDTKTATPNWTQFTGPSFSLPGNLTAEMSFRLGADGGNNSVLIALPEIAGPSIENLMPNPNFTGTGGTVVGNVTGTVPDSWRGFAINGGAITLATVPVAANELYPGSPSTNAVQLTVNTFAGNGQGFDNEVVRVPVAPAGRSIWGEVYIRSANLDNSPQGFTFQLNGFSAVPAFLGGPNTVNGTATTSWGYFGTTSYLNVAMATADLAIRLVESGSNNSILIAMPRINGLGNQLFEDGFEN